MIKYRTEIAAVLSMYQQRSTRQALCCSIITRSLSTATVYRGRFYSPVITNKGLKRATVNVNKQVEREALKRKRAQQRRITLLEYTKGQTFNQAEFKQRVAGVLLKISELRGLGLLLTKIKIKEETNTLQIFWTCKSLDKQDINKVTDILHNKGDTFNLLMTTEFGDCPRHQFVVDNNHNWEKSMNKIVEELGDLTREDETSILDQLNSLKLESEMCFLPRDDILKQLKFAQEKEDGKLRMDLEQTKKFKEDYLQSVSHHGAAEKKQIKLDIKKFLGKRNALLRENINR